jgi:ankyrin repeat protein
MERFKLLLQYQANPDIPLKGDLLTAAGYLYAGWTPLILAVEHEKMEIIEALLSSGAQPLKTDKTGRDALRHALEAENPSRQVIQRLVMEDYLLHTKGEYLNAAVVSGQADIIRMLVKAGAQVNQPDADSETPLLKVRFEKHPELMSLLLELGANPFYVANFYSTVQGHLKYAELGPEQREFLKQQLLTAQTQWLENIRQHKGAPESIDATGWTDLMTAIAANDFDLVKDLLENGANPNHKDLKGVPALLLASAVSPECLSLLIDAGADIDIRDGHGDTSLIFAAQMGKTELVQFLLRQGADADLENTQSKTALDLAIEAGDIKTARLLRSPQHQRKRLAMYLKRQLQLWAFEFSNLQLLLTLWLCL